jgi:hypothetical protein
MLSRQTPFHDCYEVSDITCQFGYERPFCNEADRLKSEANRFGMAELNESFSE